MTVIHTLIYSGNETVFVKRILEKSEQNEEYNQIYLEIMTHVMGKWDRDTSCLLR